MANEFIWHLPTEAQQAMTYATNAAKADLAKQENMYRMAELGMKRQQAEQTNQLNRLITENQIQQHQLDRESQERLADARNRNYLEGLRIQFPEGRLNPEAQKQEYDRKLRAEQEQQDANLAQQFEKTLAGLDEQISKTASLDKAPKSLEGQTVTMADIGRLAVNPVWGMTQLDYSGKRNVRDYLRKQLQRDPSDEEIATFIKETKAYRASPDTEQLGALTQRRLAIMNQLQQYGWTYNPTTKKIIRPSAIAAPITGPGVVAPPPVASALNAPPPVDARIDAIKREAAMAIQRGANPAAVYQRMAEMGVDIR